MKNINQSIIKATISVVIVMTFLSQSLYSQEKVEYTLQNPITTEHLKTNLQRQSPMLILTPEKERMLKKKLKTDPLVQSYYKYLKNEAAAIFEKPLLKRELEGFRLLFVSREMAERMGILCMIYRMEKNPEILARIDAELKAVCNFKDWNPQHFLDRVRWVIDPGNQRYYLLNKIGFNLAGHCQECPRWTLLTKKNQGHSTITVNDERFDVSGKAEITDFNDGAKPEVRIDMTDLYFGNLASLERKFIKESNRSVLIEDFFEINDSTETITWGLMTVADLTLTEDGAILNQDGKELEISILEPKGISLSVISLDPPPLEIDKTIDNFKRLEISVPAWTVENRRGTIKVRLSK